MTEWVDASGMVVSAEALPLLRRAGLASFDDFMNFSGGTRICHKRGRSVVRFEIDGRAFYLKRNRLHRVEFWKALARFRWPALGATVEWENILALQKAGIPTVVPVAVGEHTCCGLETASFTVTEELYGAEPLDKVVRREFAGSLTPEKRREKWLLIRSLAAVARKFHGSGMNHQDFYLNHFFLGQDGTIYLLDLQRVVRRSQVPEHYRVKDLAQLNYSTQVYGGFLHADRMRFLLEYFGVDRLRQEQKSLVRKVLAKTARIAKHDVKLMQRRRKRGEIQ